VGAERDRVAGFGRLGDGLRQAGEWYRWGPYPTGSGRRLPLGAVAQDLRDRLISIFVVGPDWRRPCFGRAGRLQHDPAWKDNLVFSEYFHGDNAAGLGASHQTGWTGLIADVIRQRHGEVSTVGDVIRHAARPAQP
jgi:hypothetical protein